MLFANVCAGFIRSCFGICGEWRLWGILGAHGGPVHIRGTTLAYKLCWFTPLCLQDLGHAGVPIAGVGGGWWGHYLRRLPGVHRFPPKCARKIG